MQLYRILSTPLALARSYLSQVVREGDWVVDATLGKGRDLLFLCELVGEPGKVFGFDIQEEALSYTNKILEEKGWLKRVQLIHESHAYLSKYLVPKSIKAVMFNLGYLPGGDHSIITKPDSTLAALNQSLEILDDGGIITIVVYYGHPGGILEKRYVEDFLSKLDSHLYSVVKIDFFNRQNNPPLLMIVEKREKGVDIN